MKEPTVRVLRGMNSHALSLFGPHSYIIYTGLRRGRSHSKSHMFIHVSGHTHTYSENSRAFWGRRTFYLHNVNFPKKQEKQLCFLCDERAFLSLTRLEGFLHQHRIYAAARRFTHSNTGCRNITATYKIYTFADEKPSSERDLFDRQLTWLERILLEWKYPSAS